MVSTTLCVNPTSEGWPWTLTIIYNMVLKKLHFTSLHPTASQLIFGLPGIQAEDCLQGTQSSIMGVLLEKKLLTFSIFSWLTWKSNQDHERQCFKTCVRHPQESKSSVIVEHIY